ncbi:major facilitator superfamily domain-containing protein [Irpex lacteus]|nr:major facilitator superfamily domain-containing protein [Irpex lacteus]
MSNIEKRDSASVAEPDNEKAIVTEVNSREALDQQTYGDVDEVYREKCQLINECLQYEIGFGRYQRELFLLSGLGWLADNLWLQGVAVLLPQINTALNPSRVEYTTLALYAGLITGSVTWGSLSDIIGRKLSWQITLCIAGIFGIAAGGSKNFVTLCSLVACMAFGVGGNLPVDGALFLENIPQSHQWLLTFLSAWWSVGQVVGSLIIWGFVANYSDDKGWRYSFYTLGSMTFGMFICRYFIFQLQESPKFLVAAGRDQEAVDALTYIAKRNGKTITLTSEKLLSLGTVKGRHGGKGSLLWQFKNSFAHLSLDHVRPLFSNKRLALNTTLIIVIWGLLGLAYPLFNGFLVLYLQDKITFDSSLNHTYRDYIIVAVLGVPGSAIACFIVDWTRGSNRGRNAMYGVLYAYTPEVFPTPHRGTGDALASAFNRVMGLISPLIKIATTSKDGTASVDANVPVFISASLFVLASILAMLLPIETAGKAVL